METEEKAKKQQRARRSFTDEFKAGAVALVLTRGTLTTEEAAKHQRCGEVTKCAPTGYGGNDALRSAQMSTARRVHYSYVEYLGALADSEIKLEYFDGEIYAMAGGTLAHAELSARLIALLSQALGAGCRVFSSDAKVQVEATGLATFPDASVVCGEVQRANNDQHALVNPTLLVEVTSRSTEDYDRGEKVSHYRQAPSLRAILVVSHRSARVTVLERSETSWTSRELRAGEQLVLEFPRLSVSIDALYQDITLEP